MTTKTKQLYGRQDTSQGPPSKNIVFANEKWTAPICNLTNHISFSADAGPQCCKLTLLDDNFQLTSVSVHRTAAN